MTDELKAAIAAWLDADLKVKALQEKSSELSREQTKTMFALRMARESMDLASGEVAQAVDYHHGDAMRIVAIGGGNGMLLRHSCSGPEVVMVRIEEIQPEGGA